MVPNPLKKCSVCGEMKSLNDFYNKKDSKDGKSYRCKSCDNKARQNWQRNNPERAKESAHFRNIKKRYGITKEEYNKMLKQQNYKCAICGAETANRNVNYSFCVDHNHTTGEVRGLLCSNCNRALGLLQDNPEILRKAAKYLEEK